VELPTCCRLKKLGAVLDGELEEGVAAFDADLAADVRSIIFDLADAD
jgi:hypothetical protein